MAELTNGYRIVGNLRSMSDVHRGKIYRVTAVALLSYNDTDTA